MTCTVLLAVVTLGACNGWAGNDEGERYFQRSETITLSAGDAKQVNAAAHIINPWPRGVYDRRIVTDARRTAGAVSRYQTSQRPLDQLPDIGEGGKAMGVLPPTQTNINVTGSGAGATGISVPVAGTGR